VAEQLGTLHVCLERLSGWDGEDARARVRMFAGDIPCRDQPLPGSSMTPTRSKASKGSTRNSSN
jgi:hypothetical protein